MKILISMQQPDLDQAVDERFGRAACFVKVDSESREWEALTNPGVSQSGGAGVAAAQYVIDQAVDAVISGDFGPHASQALKAANIQMALFPKGIGSGRAAFEKFLNGELENFA